MADESTYDLETAGAPINRYKQNTAFIIMWMNPGHADLIDVNDTVHETFSKFGISATRADDIEHEGIISQRILDEIKNSEFLFADLTGERPNVYYEVGYAHALGKRVILFRKEGTGIHFDLAGYNCPEYKNIKELREKLTKRLESLTNKSL
jgi:nucleoside 2-deoxyribosyltransferase